MTKKEEQENMEDTIKDKTEETAEETIIEESAAEAEESNDELSLLKKSLEEKDCQVQAATDKLLRNTAEFDNIKKRLEKEKTDFKKYALEPIMKDLVTVVDNLDRALSHARENEAHLKEGVELTLKQLTDILSKYGLTEIESLGKDFDPTVHEAVSKQPSQEYAEGKVMEVMQRGYNLNGRLLRPALVVISHKD